MTTFMLPQFIDTPRALDLLRKAVAEKGADYVYPHFNDYCVNVEYDEETQEYAPSCIIGHALQYAGISAQRVYELGYQDYSAGDLDVTHTYAEEEEADGMVGLVIFDNDDTINVWTMAQVLQDYGFPWGAALRAAERVAETGENWREVLEEYQVVRDSVAA